MHACMGRHFCVLVKSPKATQCTADGSGISEGAVGRRAKFKITARDEGGSPVGQGGDRFDVLIFTDDGDCITEVRNNLIPYTVNLVQSDLVPYTATARNSTQMYAKPCFFDMPEFGHWKCWEHPFVCDFGCALADFHSARLIAYPTLTCCCLKVHTYDDMDCTFSCEHVFSKACSCAVRQSTCSILTSGCMRVHKYEDMDCTFSRKHVPQKAC